MKYRFKIPSSLRISVQHTETSSDYETEVRGFVNLESPVVGFNIPIAIDAKKFGVRCLVGLTKECEESGSVTQRHVVNITGIT